MNVQISYECIDLKLAQFNESSNNVLIQCPSVVRQIGLTVNLGKKCLRLSVGGIKMNKRCIFSYGRLLQWCTVWYHQFCLWWSFYLIFRWIKRIYYLEVFVLLNTVWFSWKPMIPRDRWLRPWFGGLVWCLVLLVGRLLRDSLFGPPLYSPSPNISSRTISPKRDLEREKARKKNRPPKKVHTHKNPRECSPNNSNLCRNCVNLCQARVYRCMLLGCSTIYYSWRLMNRARPHISKTRTERPKERKLSKSKPDQMR